MIDLNEIKDEIYKYYDDNIDLNKLFFDRDNYELKIAEYGKTIIKNDNYLSEFKDLLNKFIINYNDDKKNFYLCVSLLLICETIYRTRHYKIDDWDDIFILFKNKIKNSSYFNDVSDFIYYIDCLIKYASINKISQYKDMYENLSDKFNNYENKTLLINHSGLINIYCESIAYYYENNLDLVDEDNKIEYTDDNKIIIKNKYICDAINRMSEIIKE